METTQIAKDKFLELLCEAYQAGYFGYMELKETQCEKIAEQCEWQLPEEKLSTITPLAGQAISGPCPFITVNTGSITLRQQPIFTISNSIGLRYIDESHQVGENLIH